MRLAFLPVALFLAFSANMAGSAQGAGAATSSVAPDQIAGKVVDAKSDRPLPHAVITLDAIEGERRVATVVSDEEGNFRFTDPLPAGKYRLSGEKEGYMTAAYLQHDQFSTAIVTGAHLATNNLRLVLMPAASFAGRIADERGEPVPQAMVTLFRENLDAGTPKITQVNSRQVDDDGHYEIYPVQPGRYFLLARGTPWYAVHPQPEQEGIQAVYRASVDPSLDVAYPTTFYPAATSEDGAAALDVKGGEELTANFQLVPQHAVTLTLRGGATPQAPVQLMQKVFATTMPVDAQVTVYNGVGVVTGVPPGRYTLQQYAGGNHLPFTAETVDLTGGSVTRQASAAPASGSLTLHLRTLNGDPLPARTMVTLSSADAGPVTSVPVNEKGEAEFKEVTPGDYSVRVAGNRRPMLPVGAVTLNGKPAADRRLHIRDPADSTATITLSGPPVRVEGVATRNGKPAPGVLVILVPAGGDMSPEMFRRDQSDLDGSFVLPGVAPGQYLLVALEDAWELPWSDLHALEPYLLHAQPVLVQSNASGVVHLPTPVSSQALR